ncbi:MAG: hypothetical protein ACTSRI_12790 [Promethearchaeota archaeon]
MARVSVDMDFMVDLINFKLNSLKKNIKKILKKWNYTSTIKFLDDAKNGTLSEAEEDAIILINLQDQVKYLIQTKLNYINK